MSYLYAKCVGQENVIPVWLFFMLMRCSQRETLFLLRVDEGSTILRSFTTEFTCGKQQLKLGVGRDGCNLEARVCVCVCDKPKKMGVGEMQIRPSACCLCTDSSATFIIRGPACVIHTHKASVRHLAESPPGANELEM